MMTLVIALSMCVTMGVSAFAAGTDSSEDAVNPKGSITVENAKSGETYKAYKIFDVTYKDTDDSGSADAYSYTITSDSPWYTVVADYAAIDENSDDTPDKGLTLTAIPGTSTTYNVAVDSTFSAADFAQYLYKYADDTMEGGDKTTVDVTDPNAKTLNDGSVSDLELGYWFVTTTVGSLCNLTTTEPAATIYDKNIVEFEKTESDATVEVGQTVTYTLKSKVPTTEGYTKYFYTFTDTMSTGLTFDPTSVNVVIKNADSTSTDGEGNEVVTTGETLVTLIKDGTVQNDYTSTVTYAKTTEKYKTPPISKGGADGSATVSENSFAILLGDYLLTDAAQAYVDKEILITYTATVNENAIERDEENNKAKLTYSNNPNDDSSKDEQNDEQHLYSFNIVIDKYATDTDDSYNTEDKLSGAKFVLYKRGEGTTTKPETGDYDTVTTGTGNDAVTTYYPISYYKYNETDKKVEWVTTKDDATEVETGEDGAAQFNGLKAGTYYLRETEAPTGYNLLESPVTIVLTATESEETTAKKTTDQYNVSATADGAAATIHHKDDNAVSEDETSEGETAHYDNDVDILVGNSTGSILPSTGGIGTTIFYIAGAILVIGAGVLLVTRKRMRAE